MSNMYDDTQLIIYLVSKIREKANTFIAEELESHGIKGIIPIHGDILYALFSYSELSMKGIANVIDRKKSTVTTLVEKLIKLGYVTKKNDINDNRSFLVSLTEKGKNLGTTINKISQNLISTAYEDISLEERQLLVRLLRKINDNF